MNIFTQLFKRSKNSEQIRQEIVQDLTRRELAITRDLLGPQPKGGQRDFFCLDKNTWVWYEEWVDDNRQKQQVTTKYLVRPTEIVKSQNGGAYHRLSIEEAENFQRAVKAYAKKVSTDMYASK